MRKIGNFYSKNLGFFPNFFLIIPDQGVRTKNLNIRVPSYSDLFQYVQALTLKFRFFKSF
jgi:hypothetical protein